MDSLFIRLFTEFFKQIEFETLTEDEKLIIKYQKREEDLSDFMNDFLINKTNILWNKKGELKIPPSIFIQKFLEILKEYLNYTQLKYFSIPIIGKISSGKSTFLNSLLGLDCLESDTQITTKFICIIRHNKDNETPRLFPVILKKRKSEINQNAYNFFKDEKNELSGDIKENIKRINKKISDCGELGQLKKEEFFYILEANLDIFKGTNFVYSKMFEFLDIPGLNEITEFYLKNIIPIITPNTHFSIFLFDAGGSEDQGSKDLFNKFLHLMNSKAKKNSFFIYNKLDIFKKDDLSKLKENEQMQILYFKNEILFRDYNLKLKHNHLVGLDSIQLKYDKKKGNSYPDYIHSFIQSIPNFDKKKFPVLFKNKMKDELKIKDFKVSEEKINENKTDANENMLNDINKALELKYYEKIDLKYYLKMKILFNEYNKNFQQADNKNDKYSQLYQLFNQSFKDTINDFVGNENLKLLIKTFNTLLIRLYELSPKKDEKKHIKDIIYHMCKHFLSFLYPNISILKKQEGIDDDIIRFRFLNFEYEIKNIFDWNKEIISSLKENLDKYKEFNSILVNKMTLNVDNVLNYLNNRKLRIAFIGQEFSGKSSILGNIIGTKILPLHEINKNSNINIIFQCSIDEKVELYKAKIKLVDNYCIFEKEKEVIVSGYNAVKNKLVKLKCEECSFDDSFYILKTPIEYFQVIKIGQEILNKIEIIYLSGKYIKNIEFGANKNLEALIKHTDNFIYIEKEKNISEKNILLLKKVIFFISTINNSFNIEKFLYIINKTSKDDLTKTLINPLINYLPKVCWFSKDDYEKFLFIRDLVKEEEKFFKYIINKVKTKENNNLLKLLDGILNEINALNNLRINSLENFVRRFIINTYLDYFIKKPQKTIEHLYNLFEDEGIGKEYLKKNNDKIVKIADEFSILQNGIYNHVYYFDSNAEIFFSELYNLIFNIKYYLDYNLKITTENTKDYLKSILSLINRKIMETDTKNVKFFFQDNNEANKLLENFDNYFKELKKINLQNVEKYENKFISNIDNIYQKKLDQTKNVDELMEKEEELFFYSILDKLSKYDENYRIFKEKNNLNDVSICSKIFINDYNRSNINKDSIKTEFKFGWFFLYSIKNTIKNKFLLPKSICYLYQDKNLNKEQCRSYYEFRYKGFKYFINNILEDIHYDMKNNLDHIILLKSEKFDKINENVNRFLEIYIDLFDLFDDDEEDEQNKK